MRDPIDELESFTSPGLTMNPMTASEVRRRGTRLRRRNTALATAGGVLAVAVIATPLALMTGHRDGSEPQPAKPTPSVPWVQTIPADFDLSVGMGTQDTTVTSDREPVVSESICGVAWTMTHTPQDQLSSSMENAGSEGGHERHLVVFADADEATAELQQFREAPGNCDGVYSDEGSAYEMIPATTAASSADEAAAWVQAAHDDAGLTGEGYVVVAQQVGNAVLLDRALSMGVGDEDVRQDGVDNLLERDTKVVEAMCIFAASGCGSTSTAVDPTPDGSTTVTTVPDDFPLLDGLPTRAATEDFGRYGPDQDHDLLTVRGCGEQMLETPATADWTRGGWHDPAEARERQLVVFDSVAEAMEYVGSFEDLITCQAEDLGDGATRILSGAGSDLGDQALIGVTWYRQDGKPAPGFQVTEMVRVGNAVIVQDRIADGLNDLVTSAYLEQIISASDESLAGVVDAMQVFGPS